MSAEQDKPPPPPPPPPPAQQHSDDCGERRPLFGDVTSFNQVLLKKTETRIRTEDGKLLRETKDDCGNYKSVVINKDEFGFIPDCRLDLQIGKVRDNLLISSQDVAADTDLLEENGVTHILNLGSYVKNYYPNKIAYKNIKLNDTIDQEVLKFFDLAFKFIDEGRQNGCVLIHCNAGVSRASTFMIGYLMNRDRMPLDDAFEFVKSKRPAIRPNAGFLNQLRQYNRELGLGEAKM